MQDVGESVVIKGIPNRVFLNVNNDGSINIAGMNIPPFDYIDLSYTGSNLTGVVYKAGGAGGTVVATLTLGYSGSNLVSIART